MKVLAVLVLVALGIYWLFDHSAPFPLNHEQFGLYNHTIHRIMGLAFFGAAILLGYYLMMKGKKN